MSTTPSLDGPVDALVGAFASMAPDEQRLIAAGYRLLSGGAPVELAALAPAAGWAPEAVGARLRCGPAAPTLTATGRLVRLWGMAVEAVSSHRARFAGQAPVWMWCALDPLLIVPVLDAPDTEVTSTSPAGEPIHLRVGPDGVSAVEPASTVVSFLMPDGPFNDDVRQAFCHFVHFFVSSAAADAWTAHHPSTFWLPVDDAAEAGRRLAGRAFAAAIVD